MLGSGGSRPRESRSTRLATPVLLLGSLVQCGPFCSGRAARWQGRPPAPPRDRLKLANAPERVRTRRAAREVLAVHDFGRVGAAPTCSCRCWPWDWEHEKRPPADAAPGASVWRQLCAVWRCQLVWCNAVLCAIRVLQDVGVVQPVWHCMPT